MKLSILLENIPIKASNIDLRQDCEGIASDSRKTVKNGVFFAIKGMNVDGSEFIEEALDHGVLAVISENELSCPYIQVENVRLALAIAWSNYYKNSSKKIKGIAITGTNGKSTTAHLIYNILKRSQKKCGLISTIECIIDGKQIDLGGGSEVIGKSASMTTPDPEILYKLVNEMYEKRVEYVVLEASSHALSQYKLDAFNIEVGIFTNLSHEHLDYHKSMDNYFKAKSRLFELCKVGIVNIDDEFGIQLCKRYKSRMLTYSVKQNADISLIGSKMYAHRSKLSLLEQNAKHTIDSNLIGSFNAYNVLAATLCSRALGISWKNIKDGIKATKSIKGRLERYKNKCIFIDYAHTPDAMEKVILEIKALYPKKRIITLFGCGGNRDRAKRAKMGEIAAKNSDSVIVTSDNSRDESLIAIINDIKKGVANLEKLKVIYDRRKAIEYAVGKMTKKDVLLLLGKGHEDYEININGKTPFDERKILNEIFQK